MWISQDSLDNFGLFVPRQPMDAREKRETVVMTPLCHLFIRKYHEFFDELVRIISFPFFDIEGCFFDVSGRMYFLKLKVDFCRLESDFSLFAAAFFENAVESKSSLDRGIEVYIDVLFERSISDLLFLTSCQFILHDVIIDPSVSALDNPLHNISMCHIATCINLHDTGECELLSSRMETTEVIREDLWKHRDDFIGCVDTGGSQEGFSVEERILGHVLSNISNMNRKRISATFFSPYRDGVIKVFCIGTIDGHGVPITKISSMSHMWDQNFDTGHFDIFPRFDNSLRKISPGMREKEDETLIEVNIVLMTKKSLYLCSIMATKLY